MSGSLQKKRNLNQKENSNRLSNSKITNSYTNPTLHKMNCSQFVNHPLPFDQKLKNNHRKTGRIKTTRKHQLSVEYILQNRQKEPYSMRSTQIQREKSQKQKNQKEKVKIKRKKKQKASNESSRFIVPVFQFSRSNSLIVFSEKDSTINPNLNRQKNCFFAKNMTPNQAATLIQKTWRGYLTRKLLQQYIHQEESKIVNAINYLRSKEESFFIEEKQEQMDFSDFSQIKEETIQYYQRRQIQNINQAQTNTKPYEVYTTEHDSGNKQSSPIIQKNFFKHHKTEPCLESNKKLKNIITIKEVIKKTQFAIDSEVFSYSFSTKLRQQSFKQFLMEQSLQNKINRMKESMNGQWKRLKKQLKDNVTKNQLKMDQLLKRNKKINQIYENSQQFLDNVFQQLKAMLIDMNEVANQGFQEEIENNSIPQRNYQPKSQLFTIQLQDNEPQISIVKPHFSQGQQKIQSYLSDLIEDHRSNHSQISELEYLCYILKMNSERGVKTLIERCLLQFSVETITQNYPLQQLCKIANQTSFGETSQQLFVVKWINQLNKWEMGPIQQVTQAMESSSLINEEPLN